MSNSTATNNTAARVVAVQVKALRDAQASFKSASLLVARTRVVRAAMWARLSEAMGGTEGFGKRGVPTKMAQETGFSKALLYVMRDDAKAIGGKVGDLDFPVKRAEGQVEEIDYLSERWTKDADLAKAAATMERLYNKRAEDKREERATAAKAKADDAAKGQTSDGSEETGAKVAASTEGEGTLDVSDVTKALAGAVSTLETFTADNGLTKAQAKALRAMLAKAETLIAGATA